MIGIDVKGRFRVSVKRETKKECKKRCAANLYFGSASFCMCSLSSLKSAHSADVVLINPQGIALI